MCGIAGLVGSSADRATIERMTDALFHRGPDDRGIWVSDIHRAAFGHHRLSIVDLSQAGHQPMRLMGPEIAMVYNGELYNTDDLRWELEAEGHRFNGHSDSEVLLHGFAQWGVGCLTRNSGMFAFAILDEPAGRLYLARDRCGQKPLYCAVKGDTFAFASEIKALHQWSSSLQRRDGGALQEYLAYGYTLGPRTLTSGVYKLLPGELLTYDLSTRVIKTAPYFSIPKAAVEPLSAIEAEERLEELLENSVRRHLVSDVPAGILLSGGIDSSLVTAMAARVQPGVRTFSVTFPGASRFDESAYARRVARHFDTDHTELEMETFGPEVLYDLAYQFDEPIADHAIVPTYLLSRRIRESVTVALGGDGGDELFGGYPHYGIIARQSALRRVPGPARHLLSRLCRAVLPPGSRGRNHLIGLDGPVENAIAHVNLFFDASLRRRLLDEPLNFSPEQRKVERLRGVDRNPMDLAMVSDFQSHFPKDTWPRSTEPRCWCPSRYARLFWETISSTSHGAMYPAISSRKANPTRSCCGGWRNACFQRAWQTSASKV